MFEGMSDFWPADREMPDRKHVLVIDDWSARSYYRPFSVFGKFTNDFDLLFKDPESIRLVVFTGGADINPVLYNEKPSLRTFCFDKRDEFEFGLYTKIERLGIPIAGICRGAQFLCAMAGGKLYQHVTGHDAHHWCKSSDNRKFMISSSHHQMLRLPSSAKLLAWAEPRISNIYIGADDVEMDSPEHEVEAAYFPNINAVGMQYHPEIMTEYSTGFQYCQELIKKYLKLEPDVKINDDDD